MTMRIIFNPHYETVGTEFRLAVQFSTDLGVEVTGGVTKPLEKRSIE